MASTPRWPLLLFALAACGAGADVRSTVDAGTPDAAQPGVDASHDALGSPGPDAALPDASGALDGQGADAVIPGDEGTATVDVVAPPACEAGPSSVVSAVTDPSSALALGVGEGSALVAWLDQGAVLARVLSGGSPAGDPVVIEQAPEQGEPAVTAVSGIEVLTIDGGFAVFWSRGLLDGGAPVVLQARVAVDGSLTMPPTVLTTGLELGRGSGVGEIGFRLWGLRDVDDPDTGGLSRQAAMARVAPTGELQEIHYMLNASKFTYMRLHHSGNQLNTPFVGPSSDRAVAYFLASIYLQGCGLPVEPVIELGESAQLAASGFLSPLDVLWAVREQGADRMVFHDVAARTSDERPLSFAPSDRADMASNSTTGLVLLADFADGALVGAVADPAGRSVGSAEPIEALAPGAAPLALRVEEDGAGWMLAWITGAGGEVRTRRYCPAP
jgi:hypothetical protein